MFQAIERLLEGRFQKSTEVTRSRDLEFNSPGVRLGRESELYRACYYEFPTTVIAANLAKILKSIVPSDFVIGDEDNEGDLQFRLIRVPNDPEECKRRIEEIAENGSDRTDPDFESLCSFIYRAVAPAAGVTPLDVFDCYGSQNFFSVAKRRFRPRFVGSPDPNVILVYDAKTENGIRQIVSFEYTFKNLSQKYKALLAIIGLK